MATIRNDRDKLLQSATVRVIRTVLMTLSKYLVVLAADSEGFEEDITKANISVSILVDGTEDVTNWSLSVATTGCTAHVSGDDIIFDGFDVLNTTDSCSITVTATKSTFTNQVATLEIVRARSGSISTELSLSPSIVLLPADYTGNVTSYDGAVSTAKLIRGFTDVTADWTLSKVDSPGVLSVIDTDEVSVIGFAGPSDGNCIAALDLDSLTFKDSSKTRRIWASGVSNAPTSTIFNTPTLSTSGPAPGYSAVSFVSDGTASTCIRSYDPSFYSSLPSYGVPQRLNDYSFALSFFVSFSNASSANIQYLYSTSSPSYASTNAISGPLAIVKNAGTNSISVIAENFTSYSSNQVLITTPATLVNNQFYNIALNYNVTTRVLSLFLDGLVVGTATLNNSLPSGNQSMVMNLGSRAFGSTANNGLNGKMAMFKLWNTDKFRASFTNNSQLQKLPIGYDLLSDKVVIGLDFTKGTISDSVGTVFQGSTTGTNVAFHTDSDGTGAIITGGFLQTGLLGSLKLTGAFCVEMKVKFLTGFDFAVTVNSPTTILSLTDSAGTDRLEFRAVNPGALGAAYSASSIRTGPSSSDSVQFTSNLTVTDVVYHLCINLDPTSSDSLFLRGKMNGLSSSSGGATTSWYHANGTNAYRLKIGNTQVNKGSKMVVYWVKITSGNRRYDYDFTPPTEYETLQTSGYVDVTATKLSNSLIKRLSVNKQLAGAPSSRLEFTPGTLDIRSDGYGWVASLPTVSIDVLIGTTSDYGNWTTSVSANSGIQGTLSGETLTLTNLVSTNDTKLMLQGGSFSDVSEYRRAVTPVSFGSAPTPTISTDWSPFGGPGNCYKFDNNNSNQQAIRLSPGSNAMHISTSNYTLEMFVMTDTDPSLSTFMLPLWHRGTGVEFFGSDLCLLYDNTNKWRVSSSYTYANPFDSGGTSTIMTYPSAPDMVAKKSYHVAVVRNGTAVYLYINGTRYTSSTNLAGGFSYYNTNQDLFIGYRQSATYAAIFRVAQVRFTIGTARYTATSITVPTSPFVAETPDTGFIEVTSTKTGFPNLVKRLPYTKTKESVLARAAVTTSLSTQLLQVLGDITGVVPSGSYSGMSTVASVIVGGIDDSANWSFTETGSTGITVTKTGNNQFNVTALTNAFTTGTISIVASRPGYTDVNLVCNVTKLRQLAPAGLAKGVLLGIAYDWSTSAAATTVTFKTDGTVTLGYIGATITTNWYNPTTTGVGSSYHVTITGPTIGTSMSGVTLGTAYQLTSDRAITVNQNATGDTYGRYTYTIRADSGGTPAAILASGFFDISSQVV